MWSSLISLNLEREKKAFAESSELKSRSPKVCLPFVCRSLLLILAILDEVCEVPGWRRKRNRSNRSSRKTELLDAIRRRFLRATMGVAEMGQSMYHGTIGSVWLYSGLPREHIEINRL